MTKTLKQILGEKPILFTADVPERVKEWLAQKREEHTEVGKANTAFKDWSYRLVIDELLEELQPKEGANK